MREVARHGCRMRHKRHAPVREGRAQGRVFKQSIYAEYHANTIAR
jgi:hypothetical protein